jgi:radical SAM superfamily enzyme YgiQ (UPF0313 family)
MHASIIHVPKGLSASDWSHNYINMMAAGTFSVANYANAHGHRTTVLNTAVYGSTSAALARLFETIAGNDSQVVGLPLHWYFSGADVLWAADRIKERCPAVKVVLGGITASIYGDDLMRECSSVDAVVHGDGEVPFCRYLTELERGPEADLAAVPNLRWRRGTDIVWNRVTHVATPEQYSAFDYGISKIMKDLREYATGWGMRVDIHDGGVNRSHARGTRG